MIIIIKIAVCDDNPQDAELVRSQILKYSTDKHIKFDISVFNSPEQLIFELQDSKIADIFILDVSMPGKNGFELADEIRKYTSTSAIIFLTSMTERASEGYKTRALRYVIKFNMERDLQEAIDCAVKEVSDPNDNVVTLHRYNDYWRITYSDIIYVSRVSRLLVITTSLHGEITDNRGIMEFFNMLNDSRFLFIDRSCFVNIDYISQIIGYNLKLKNGTLLPISRRSLQSVKQTLFEHWKL